MYTNHWWHNTFTVTLPHYLGIIEVSGSSLAYGFAVLIFFQSSCISMGNCVRWYECCLVTSVHKITLRMFSTRITCLRLTRLKEHLKCIFQKYMTTLMCLLILELLIRGNTEVLITLRMASLSTICHSDWLSASSHCIVIWDKGKVIAIFNFTFYLQKMLSQCYWCECSTAVL